MTNTYIFWGVADILKSMVYSFPCRGFSHRLLSLFLSILFFEATVNGIIFLYSFSICSLWVDGKITDFYKLILYPVTLLKLFMVSSSIFGKKEIKEDYKRSPMLVDW
jgi:hypothetical protein